MATDTGTSDTPMRRRRMPEQRPAQIMEAALAVFGEQGFEHARLEDVAERAQVSKGTIYNYFPSKESLFEEMVRQTLADLLDVAAGTPPDATAESELRAFLTRVWNYVRSAQFETIYRLIMAELPRFPQLGQYYTQEVREHVKAAASDIIRHGVASGEFRALDEDTASRMLLALLIKNGVWCGRRETWPGLAQRSDAQVLEEIIDFYLHAVMQRSPS